MTLIFEIAGGIVLGVAMIALVVTFWEGLAIGLALAVGLALAAAGVAILYYVFGNWETAAWAVSAFAAMGGAAFLIQFLNSHEKYGPSFRAVGNSVGAGTVLATFASLIIWLPLAILSEKWIRLPYQYILVLPTIVTFVLSTRFFYRHDCQKELDAARGQSA